MGITLLESQEKIQETEHVIRTSCKDCIFAKWEGNNQTSCEFARIERFEANGGVTKISFKWERFQDISQDGENFIGILDAWVLCEYHNNKLMDYDDDNVRTSESIDKSLEVSYYLINRFCNYCRDKNWATDVEKHPKEAVVEENEIEFTWLIYIDKQWKIEDLKNVTEQIRGLAKASVVLVDNKSGLEELEVINALNHTNLEWRRVYISQPDAPMNFALDEAYKWIKTQFFGEFKTPVKTIPVDMVEQLDIAINQRLERLLTITYKSIPNFHIFYTKLVKLMTGNSGIQFYKDNKSVEGVFNKLKYLAKQQNNEYLIKENV